MIRLASILLFAAIQFQGAIASELSDKDRMNMMLFFHHAMGLSQIKAADVKSLPSPEGAKTVLAAGLIIQGKLCASVIRITALPNDGFYEVTCVAVAGGRAEKTYLVDPESGKADSL
jgi:hypothetical protein